MIRINQRSVELDIKSLQNQLSDFSERDVRHIARKAINETGFQGRKTLIDIAMRTFEGGISKYTQRGFFFVKATLQDLTGVMTIRSEQAKYMRLQIFGGTRVPKSGGKLYVPSRKHKDKLRAGFGNKHKTTRRFISTKLEEARQAYNRQRDRRKRTFFVGVPRNAKYPGSGLFERKKRNTGFFRLLAFKPSADYQKKFDYFGIFLRTAQQKLPQEILRQARIRLAMIKGSTSSTFRGFGRS